MVESCRLRLRLATLPVWLNAIHEGDAGTHQWQKVCTVEPPPPGLRHIEELVGHQEPLRARACALRDPLTQPHLANGDSITFDVRRCFQCSAGKSKNVSSTSASFSRVVTAFGYFGTYSVANRVIA